ncbi:MAG TPA: hypothetical protein VLS89_08215 [Candidatus Nanopelagicales bacterium]|nr:hypothetical protein [Candidatus Nanopelagicales bacterium]
MRYLQLQDLKLGLGDLLTRRRPALELTSTGRLYAPMLQTKHDQIRALPAVFLGGKALAEELGDTDDTHDGFGGAVWHHAESYLRAPSSSADVVAAATRIRTTFIPELRELKATYANEASAALDRKKVLDAHRTDLEMFPLAEGKTLFDWVKGYLDAGERLDLLLSNRADAPDNSRKEAGALRAGTIGMLNRVRDAIGDELAHDPSLPRDLDAQVFGYFDELHAPRLAARARRAKNDAEAGEEPKNG